MEDTQTWYRRLVRRQGSRQDTKRNVGTCMYRSTMMRICVYGAGCQIWVRSWRSGAPIPNQLCPTRAKYRARWQGILRRTIRPTVHSGTLLGDQVPEAPILDFFFFPLSFSIMSLNPNSRCCTVGLHTIIVYPFINLYNSLRKEAIEVS